MKRTLCLYVNPYRTGRMTSEVFRDRNPLSSVQFTKSSMYSMFSKHKKDNL